MAQRNIASAFAHVDAHVDDFTHDLEEMIRVPSVSAYGERLEEMAELTASKLRGAGLEAELLSSDGPPVVYADSGASEGPTLLFYDHYDVQPAEPFSLWTSPPFEPARRDGRIFGRGANDNKGNLTGRISALRAWRETLGELPCRVKFLVEGDEEIGSPHLSGFLDRQVEKYRADALIWEGGGVDWDGAPQIVVGMKGILFVELVARGPRTEIHSRDSVRVLNPAWRLVWALATIKGDDESCLIPGFYAAVRPPNETERAAVRMMPSDETTFAESIGVHGFVRGLTGGALREWSLFQPTCNISGLASGYMGAGGKTIIPGEARVRLDFRLVPDQDPAEIVRALREHLDRGGFSDIEVQPRDKGIPGYRTTVDHPFVRLVAEAASQTYDRAAVLVPTGTGSGPLALVAGRLRVPVATAGSSNPESRNHGIDENIRVTDYARGIKHVIAILSKLAAADPSGWATNPYAGDRVLRSPRTTDRVEGRGPRSLHGPR